MRTLVKTNNNYYNELPSIFDDFSLLRNLFQQGVSKPVNSTPAVNVKETDTAYELEVAAPGLSKEDFKVDVDGQTLTISAEKEIKKEEKQDGYTRKEFNYSSFKRSSGVKGFSFIACLSIEATRLPEANPLDHGGQPCIYATFGIPHGAK